MLLRRLYVGPVNGRELHENWDKDQTAKQQPSTEGAANKPQDPAASKKSLPVRKEAARAKSAKVYAETKDEREQNSAKKDEPAGKDDGLGRQTDKPADDLQNGQKPERGREALLRYRNQAVDGIHGYFYKPQESGKVRVILLFRSAAPAAEPTPAEPQPAP